MNTARITATIAVTLGLGSIFLIGCGRRDDAPAPPPATGAAPDSGSATEPARSDADVDREITDRLGEPAIYRTTFEALKGAIARRDAPAVAALVSFPIEVRTGGSVAQVATPDEFISKYGQIVTPDVEQAMAGAQYSGLMVSGQGLMIGNGEIWLNGVCDVKNCDAIEVKVIAIQSAPAMP